MRPARHEQENGNDAHNVCNSRRIASRRSTFKGTGCWRTAGIYKVFNVKLKPGKVFEADAFVTKYLTPVDDAIGRKVITFVYQTGAWDRITYFPARATENGIDTIPSEQAWWEAFVKQEGGEEEAQARIAEFMDLVDVFEVEIAKPQRWDMVNE